MMRKRVWVGLGATAGALLLAVGLVRAGSQAGAEKANPVASPDGAGALPLVLRDRIRLTQGGSERIIQGAIAQARVLKIKANLAVVDDGGHLMAFVRMEGGRPASIYTALTKAATAATLRQPTGPLPPGAAAPDVLLNVSLQNAAAASGGKITTLYGGVPIVVEGEVIGGVGVGGGTGEQDAEIARAGISAFLAAVETQGRAGK